jgi:membrane protein
VLLCDPARTPAQPLVDQMLLTPSTATRAFRERSRIDSLRLADLLEA